MKLIMGFTFPLTQVSKALVLLGLRPAHIRLNPALDEPFDCLVVMLESNSTLPSEVKGVLTSAAGVVVRTGGEFEELAGFEETGLALVGRLNHQLDFAQNVCWDRCREGGREGGRGGRKGREGGRKGREGGEGGEGKRERGREGKEGREGGEGGEGKRERGREEGRELFKDEI